MNLYTRIVDPLVRETDTRTPAIAPDAVLALVAHTTIPEAIHERGSVVVLPTVAGFLFALYLALLDALG